MTQRPFEGASRVVVKVGSALIAENGQLKSTWLDALAGDIVQLRGRGLELLIVSSGAVALGQHALGGGRPERLEDKQAAAAFGQPRLIEGFQRAFARHGISVAQSLITLDDTEQRRRWLNARATLNTLISAGGLPVINENDTVATDEIRYGDNDRLAARVAQMVSADLLVLLSDIDGLYTADPHQTPSAVHVPVISSLTDEIEAMAGTANRKANVGTGGMVTKLAAARIAQGAGCQTLIADGRTLAPLTALEDGARFTRIQSEFSPLKARAAWLASHLKPEGEIHVDAGAAQALKAGASLLPVGIKSVTGTFSRGAAVALHDSTESAFAIGISAYSASDIATIAGCQSDEAAMKLGWRGRANVVHRDDLVVL